MAIHQFKNLIQAHLKLLFFLSHMHSSREAQEVFLTGTCDTIQDTINFTSQVYVKVPCATDLGMVQEVNLVRQGLAETNPLKG